MIKWNYIRTGNFRREIATTLGCEKINQNLIHKGSKTRYIGIMNSKQNKNKKPKNKPLKGVTLYTKRATVDSIQRMIELGATIIIKGGN